MCTGRDWILYFMFYIRITWLHFFLRKISLNIIDWSFRFPIFQTYNLYSFNHSHNHTHILFFLRLWFNFRLYNFIIPLIRKFFLPPHKLLLLPPPSLWLFVKWLSSQENVSFFYFRFPVLLSLPSPKRTKAFISNSFELHSILKYIRVFKVDKSRITINVAKIVKIIKVKIILKSFFLPKKRPKKSKYIRPL